MGFLQQRCTAACERYRSLIEDHRNGRPSAERRGNIKDQVMLYKRRCELMRTATNVGLVAAILLIAVLIMGAVDAVFSGLPPLKYLSAACAVAGFAAVIAATVLVIVENSIIQRATESELLDVPDLARGSGQVGGDITDPDRGAG